MATKPLPIEGYPHMSLTDQADEAVYTALLTRLSAAGFTIKHDRVVPPPGFTQRDTIVAISSAFQKARLEADQEALVALNHPTGPASTKGGQCTPPQRQPVALPTNAATAPTTCSDSGSH